jgi:hypothetical protein
MAMSARRDRNRLLIFLVILGVAAAMFLPERGGSAADDVVLSLPPVALAHPPSKLAAWSLEGGAGNGVSAWLNLRRSFRNARAQELHSMAMTGSPSVAFDGERGSFEVELGHSLSVKMLITAMARTGTVVDCDGRRRMPVDLRGRFILRTGTRFFGTIRRTHIRGVVYFNGEPPPDCTSPPTIVVSSCPRGSTLFVNQPAGLLGLSNFPPALPDTVSTMLAFGPISPEEVTGSAPEWSHIMRVPTYRVQGKLPTLTVHMPASSPIQGSGTFTGRQTTETTQDGCHRVTTNGAFYGTFRTRFTGWGARSIHFESTQTAYEVLEPTGSAP